MSDGFAVNDIPESQPQAKEMIAKELISKPKLNLNKFKNVLLYILEKCAGKPNVGETVLYKLLYFSDFDYYELYEEHLTGASYRKLPYGPVPQKLDSIISQMIKAGQLQRVKTEYYGLQQTRYLPLVKANLAGLKASEKTIIDRVIEQMSDWSASAISNYSHKDLPWLATKEGDEINYELSFTEMLLFLPETTKKKQMNFDELAEFRKDLRRLLKRFGSLKDDINVVRQVLEVYPDERQPFSYRIDNLELKHV